MAHGNVELAHSRAGMSDWEEIDGSKRLSVLESGADVDCMKFLPRGRFGRWEGDAFNKRASDVAAWIGRVADGLGGSLSFVSLSRGPGGGKGPKQTGLGEMRV